MARNKKQATVTVVDVESGEEEKLSVSSQGSATGLNLRDSEKIYFGGVPTAGKYRPEVTVKRFAGCMRDVEVSRTPYNLLSSPDYTGLTKGCSIEKLHTVSFSKPGFMELPGLSFAVATEISLSFSTKVEDGTILLGVGGVNTQTPLLAQLPGRRRRQSGEPYLAVLLSRGSLEVQVSTGGHSLRRVVRKPDLGILHDGREHSLRILRLADRTFIVQVDEEEKREAGLPNDQPLAIRHLFIGGAPSDVQQRVQQSIQRLNVPFEGCIWNLMVNAVLADFSQPVAFENAEIGQCPNLAPPPPPIPLPEDPKEEEEPGPAPSTPEAAVTAPPPVTPAAPPPTPSSAPKTGPDTPSLEGCAAEAEPGVVGEARQFGLSRNSHVAFAFDDTKVKTRLIIEFELRTTAESGLVFYMARHNHADFATIQIKGGLANLGFDLGHGNTSATVPRSINDGQWHKIRVMREKQRGILTVDTKYHKHSTSPKKADILDVVGMIYIGGLPVNYTTKRIGPVLQSIDGCIRNFRMLEGVLDLSAPTSSHMVGTCYEHPETGSFFDGTGYLKAVGQFRVGLDVTFDLEFRTSQSSGVLLGVSSAASDGLGLQLVDGKLLFHVDNGAGRITAEYQPDEEAGLCDGQWHSVSARKLRHRVELVVDGRKSLAESPNTRSNTADTNDPIYVGGYPEGVPQAGLDGRAAFRGCMRNVRFTKASRTVELRFDKALEVHGVQPLSCPGAA